MQDQNWAFRVLEFLQCFLDSAKKDLVLQKQHSFDDTHLVAVSEVFHQEVSPKCVNEENSTECHSYNCQASLDETHTDTLLDSC